MLSSKETFVEDVWVLVSVISEKKVAVIKCTHSSETPEYSSLLALILTFNIMHTFQRSKAVLGR